MEKKEIKLNLGCGQRLLTDYINCDLNSDYENLGVFKLDAADLGIYENDSIDEIYNSHLIEHFNYNKGLEVLKEWYRVLKPGGKLIIETPDFFYSCKYFLHLYEKYNEYFVNHNIIRNEIMKLYGHFFSEPWKPFCYHLFLYSEIQLIESLKIAGYKNINRTRAKNFIEHFPGNENIFLRMECEK